MNEIKRRQAADSAFEQQLNVGSTRLEDSPPRPAGSRCRPLLIYSTPGWGKVSIRRPHGVPSFLSSMR